MQNAMNAVRGVAVVPLLWVCDHFLHCHDSDHLELQRQQHLRLTLAPSNALVALLVHTHEHALIMSNQKLEKDCSTET